MSKQTGARCRAFVAQGFPVCKWHGGRAPQVQRAAADRIRDLVDPSLNRIQKTIADDDNPALALAAARDILDRAGLKPTEKIQTTGDSTIRVEYADAATPTVTPEHRNGHA
jgi:hypothetical protein